MYLLIKCPAKECDRDRNCFYARMETYLLGGENFVNQDCYVPTRFDGNFVILYMLKWERVELLLLLKLVSCRHIFIELYSFIKSWSSSNLLFMFHWILLLVILIIIIVIKYYDVEGCRNIVCLIFKLIVDADWG